MSALSVALNAARTYLNDDAAVTWTDAVLIPKAQEAHRELQTELWNSGSPVVRAQSGVLALSATTSVLIDFTTTPALPTDLINPTALYESVHNANVWSQMTEVNYLPLGQAQAAALGIWSWRNEAIQLIGATAAQDVIIQYRKLITIPTLNTSPIGIIFGETYIAARTAAMAAGAVGNAEVFTAMTALAKENLAKVIAANRGQQKPTSRP